MCVNFCSCKARLGSYNWAGSQSESGAWVTPAFQLHHSKIDAMSPRTATPLNIRRPLVGPGAAPAVSASVTAETSYDSEMCNGQQHTNLDKEIVPVDAARTVSEAAHAAAEIAAQIDRPTILPRNDNTHSLGNDGMH